MLYADVAILGCGWAGILAGYFILQRTPHLNVSVSKFLSRKVPLRPNILLAKTLNFFNSGCIPWYPIASEKVIALQKLTSLRRISFPNTQFKSMP